MTAARPVPVDTPAAPTSATPRPTDGIHTPATGTPRPASPGTGPAPADGGAQTSVPGAGAPLTIAQSNCRASAATAGDLQAQFDQRGPVWGGGDGAEPIPIDNGRTLWLFGDTYIGGGPYGGRLDNRGFVHNSMVVQYNGSCFAYLFRGDAVHGWYSAIPEPSDSDYYWPNAATYDPVSGVLSISLMRVHTVDPNNPWGWQLVGIDVMHYRVSPTLTILSTERLFTFGPADRAQFGTNLLADQGSVYLYGCAQREPTECFVARTNASMQAGSLAFWSHSGWVATLAAADPIVVDQPVGEQLHVAKVGDGYVASNQIPLLGSGTWGWWGPSPTGPFSPIGQLWDANDPPHGPLHSNWFSYGGRVINSSAGPIGVFSVNTADNEGATVAGVYGPRFVTIRDHLIDRDPFGSVDSTTVLAGATRLVGWTIDPDTASAISVRVMVDGQAGPLLTANIPRRDVGGRYPDWGAYHGFDAQIPLSPGVHQICVTAINTGLGKTNRSLGCLRASGAGPASGYVAVNPVRVLDSRNGTGGYSTPWSGNQTRSLAVAGVGPVPADATAVVVNVTITDATAASFLTIGPSGGLVPLASNMNFVAGQTEANLVTVQVGAGGKIDLTNHSGGVHVVADLLGYFRAGAGDRFTGVTPGRILDSRNGTGGYASPWGPGTTRSLTVAGVGAVPANATAVVMNVTVTNPTAASWLRVSPTGTPPPLTSNLNFTAGQTVPNLVVVRVGTRGQDRPHQPQRARRRHRRRGRLLHQRHRRPLRPPVPHPHPRLTRRHRRLLLAVGPESDTVADRGGGEHRPGGSRRGGDERDRHQPDGPQLAAGQPHRRAAARGVEPQLRRRADGGQPGDRGAGRRGTGRPDQPERPHRRHRRCRRLLHRGALIPARRLGAPSLRRVAHGLDVVAVGIANEGAVVVGVVLGPDPRLVQHLGPDALGGGEERPHRIPVGGGEGDVRLAKAFACGSRPQPEVRHGRDPIPDHLPEVHDPLAADSGEHGVVEAGAGGHVRALDREVIEHPPMMPPPSPAACPGPCPGPAGPKPCPHIVTRDVTPIG